MAEDIGHTLAKRPRTEVQQLSPIMVEREMNVRIYQDNALEGGEDVIEFRRIGFQELTPGWNIIKEVFHTEVTPHRTRDRFLRNHTGSSQRKVGAQFF